MKRALRALLLAAACVTSVRAQVLPPARLELGRQAMNSIYDLDYAGAERICHQLIQTDPEDPFGYALLARNMWAMQLHAGQGLTIDRFSGLAFYEGGQEQTITVSEEAERLFRDDFGQNNMVIRLGQTQTLGIKARGIGCQCITTTGIISLGGFVVGGKGHRLEFQFVGAEEISQIEFGGGALLHANRCATEFLGRSQFQALANHEALTVVIVNARKFETQRRFT